MYSRTRTDVPLDTSEPYLFDTYYLSGGSCSALPSVKSNFTIGGKSGIYQKEYVQREMSDVVTKNFEKLKSEGRIINNPMESIRESITETPTEFDFSYRVQLNGCTPARWYDYNHHFGVGKIPVSVLTTPLPVPTVSSDVVDQVVSAAHARIGHDEVLFLATIAEFNQTVSGLSYIFYKVYKILKYVRRMQLKKLRKELTVDELEEVYLNARYNLRPLYYDVNGLISVVNTPDALEKRQTFRASKEVIEDDSDVVTVNFYNHSSYYDVYAVLNREVSSTIKARAGVLTVLDRLSLHRKLGMDRLAESAWDLVPFSFIIDWFLNVGDVIGSWSPKAGIEKLASWVTVTTSSAQFINCTYAYYTHQMVPGAYNIEPEKFVFSPGSYARTVTNKVRTPDPSRVIFPSVDLNLDPLKLIDLGLITKKIATNRGGRLSG